MNYKDRVIVRLRSGGGFGFMLSEQQTADLDLVIANAQHTGVLRVFVQYGQSRDPELVMVPWHAVEAITVAVEREGQDE